MPARVSATASLGFKKNIEYKKEWGKYDNMSPHHSITLERTLDGDVTDEEMLLAADFLHEQARQLVEKKIAKDIADLQKRD